MPFLTTRSRKTEIVVDQRSRWGRSFILTLAAITALIATDPWHPALGARRSPNIVLILTDDLGYGDAGVYNPSSGIPTPNIDRLSNQGLRFVNAYGASLCVWARYQLLTGRYAFRAGRSLERDALIEPGRPTLASLLHDSGYATEMIGKWHLGFEGLGVHPQTLDYSEPLIGGPVDHGFDNYFGLHASLDTAPYFFIRNRHVVESPSASTSEHHTPGVRFIQGAFWRGGPIGDAFKHAEVLPLLAQQAVNYIQGRARSEQPFFLYLALTAPHPPWLPLKRFQGKSSAGTYGDFVMQVDEVVGNVATALEDAGKATDTLFIFTSDNGPTWYEADARRYKHSASGGWRGMKADAWEGGSRVPLIVRWSGRVAAGTSSEELVSLVDLFATFASLVEQEVPQDSAEDSFDILPILLGRNSKASRHSLVYEAVGPTANSLAVREGVWKLIPWLQDKSVFEALDDQGRVSSPPWRAPQASEAPGQLYNLADAPHEGQNLYEERPDIVNRLTELLRRIRRDGERQATLEVSPSRTSTDGRPPPDTKKQQTY